MELGSHDFGGGLTGDRLGSHQPEAIIATVPNWPMIASHELMEMLADPTTHGIEICDPVADATYTLDGVQVADFITPAWLLPDSSGPWDLTGQISGPNQLSADGY